MGVGVSLGNLSGSVAKEGAMGTISTVGIGYRKEIFIKTFRSKYKRIKKELKRARNI